MGGDSTTLRGGSTSTGRDGTVAGILADSLGDSAWRCSITGGRTFVAGLSTIFTGGGAVVSAGTGCGVVDGAVCGTLTGGAFTEGSEMAVAAGGGAPEPVSRGYCQIPIPAMAARDRLHVRRPVNSHRRWRKALGKVFAAAASEKGHR